MLETRAEWPHTREDIVRSLDSVWGLVAATNTQGNLMRLERSHQEPCQYTLTEYKGQDTTSTTSKLTFAHHRKALAVDTFACALGFSSASQP